MIPILLFASDGLASPGMAGALHLGSLPVDSGTAWAGTGGIAFWSPDGGYGGGIVQVGGAPTDRLAIDVQVATDFPYAGGFPAVVSGRYLFHEREAVRLAATWTSFALPLRDAYAWDFQVFTAHAPGIALDAGGERVRFDLALPVWGFTSYDRYFGLAHFPFPLGASLGVSGAIGDQHHLRFGLPELFSWSWRGERAYFDLGGVTIGVVGAVWTKLGFVF